MPFKFDEINLLAVLVAGLATFFLGGLWYTALFGKLNAADELESLGSVVLAGLLRHWGVPPDRSCPLFDARSLPALHCGPSP